MAESSHNFSDHQRIKINHSHAKLQSMLEKCNAYNLTLFSIVNEGEFQLPLSPLTENFS